MKGKEKSLSQEKRLFRKKRSQTGPESFPVAERNKVFSDTDQDWGKLTAQQNPILSENSFVYRFVERDNRGPGSFLPLIKGNYVQLDLNNRTAVAHINRMRGTRSQHLTALALDIHTRQEPWSYQQFMFQENGIA